MGPGRAASEDDQMTAKKDLKRRVRERQARTGESYITALRHVRAQAPEPPEPPEPPFPVLELADLTEAGGAIGLACRIAIYPQLAARVDVTRVLTRLRDLLTATAEDRSLTLMRDVVLRGEKPRRTLAPEALGEARAFVARVRAGLGGISDSGHMLALTVDGESILFALWLVPHREPMLIVTTAAGISYHPLLGPLGGEP
jgi:hypothetical protein